MAKKLVEKGADAKLIKRLSEGLVEMARIAKSKPNARAWIALIEKLKKAKNDPVIAKSRVVCDCIETLCEMFADFPEPGAEFNEIASIIGKEKAAQAVESRGDQVDKRRFQQWVIDDGIFLEQIGDLYRMRSNRVPSDIAQIISSRNQAVLKRWYKEKRPEPLKIGRKA